MQFRGLCRLNAVSKSVGRIRILGCFLCFYNLFIFGPGPYAVRFIIFKPLHIVDEPS